MYTLRNDMTDRQISRHHRLRNAVRAQLKFARAFAGSYVPTSILDADGAPIHGEHPEYHDMLRLEYSVN
jgi:hypothetical protein